MAGIPVWRGIMAPCRWRVLWHLSDASARPILRLRIPRRCQVAALKCEDLGDFEGSESMSIILFLGGALWAFFPALIEYLLVALGVTGGSIPT